MKPLFPSVNVSGYTIIEFDVDQNGKIQKIFDLLSQSVYYKKEVQMTKNSKIVGFLYMSLLLLQDI